MQFITKIRGTLRCAIGTEYVYYKTSVGIILFGLIAWRLDVRRSFHGMGRNLSNLSPYQKLSERKADILDCMELFLHLIHALSFRSAAEETVVFILRVPRINLPFK
jgi:hypothetical protein